MNVLELFNADDEAHLCGLQCATCANWICEDDQLEHQAMCQVILSRGSHPLIV